MAIDVFKNSTKSIPESDSQIVRVDLNELEIGGRKSHLPSQHKESDLGISHVGGSLSVPGNGK